MYERELGDPDAALVVLQAALKENYDYDPVVAEVERLATETRQWNGLLLMRYVSHRFIRIVQAIVSPALTFCPSLTLIRIWWA